MSPSGTRASCSRAATTSMSAGSWARSFRGLSALSGFSAMPPAPTLFLRPAPDDGGAAGGQLALQMLVAPIQMVDARSEEHTSELQSLMRISYSVFCLNKKKQ